MLHLLTLTSRMTKVLQPVKEYRMLVIPSFKSLIKLLGHVLKFNNFMINGEHYLQINRHAIGTKMHHPMLIYSWVI